MSKVIQGKKPKIIKDAQIHNSDTSSPEVRVAYLTEEIINLTAHLKSNPKDFSSRRGLLKKVGKRRSLLRYLYTVSQSRYNKTVKINKLKSL